MQPGRDGEPRAGKPFPAPRVVLLTLAAAVVLGGVFIAAHRLRADATPLRPADAAPSGAFREPAAPPADSSDEPEERAMALPSGAPTRISCEEATRVTRYLERELAAPPIAPTPGEL